MRKLLGKATTSATLTVVSATLADVFSDVARLHVEHRPFAKAGQIIVLRCGDKRAYAVARGPANLTKSQISLDSDTRERLGIETEQLVTFVIQEAGWIDEFRWAWNVTDAMPRLAARISVISLILGLIGLALGIVSIWQ